MDPKSDQNGTTNPLKMDPEVEPEFGTLKSERGKNCWMPFGATWAILDAMLGPAATPEGSPNRPFFAYNFEKMKKWMHRNDTKKT